MYQAVPPPPALTYDETANKNSRTPRKSNPWGEKNWSIPLKKIKCSMY